MMTPLLIAGVVIAILGIAIYYIQHREGSPASGPYMHFRCPHCNKKLRFPASKAGKPAMCPSCRRRWNVPAAGEKTANADELVKG